MAGIIERLQSEAIWVTKEDKKKFDLIVIERTAETKVRQSQASTFKYLLEVFFKAKGKR